MSWWSIRRADGQDFVDPEDYFDEGEPWVFGGAGPDPNWQTAWDHLRGAEEDPMTVPLVADRWHVAETRRSPIPQLAGQQGLWGDRDV